MGDVNTHAHVLRDDRIVLRLTDTDLPALYCWNADPSRGALLDGGGRKP